MKRIISFLIFFNCISIFAQREIQPEFGALIYTSRERYYNTKYTHDYSNYKKVWTNNYPYGFKLKFGPRFLSTNKSVSVNLQYQFLKINDSGYFGNPIALKSNLLGVGADLRLFEQKRVRLFFQVALLTEIQSNYIDAFLSSGSYSPTDFPPQHFFGDYVHTNIYRGTPFVGNLSLGCNVKILHGLNLNLSFGYGMRMIKCQRAELTFIKDQSFQVQTKIKNVYDEYSVPFHMLDFQAGLSYTFSMKKKSKAEE
ncbi:MAG: hypothetical protein PHQ74_10480 [Crocinitomicaceae bacterium]|nr:hypothetical protein [Crocinitomicaceae bacterium]